MESRWTRTRGRGGRSRAGPSAGTRRARSVFASPLQKKQEQKRLAQVVVRQAQSVWVKDDARTRGWHFEEPFQNLVAF